MVRSPDFWFPASHNVSPVLWLIGVSTNTEPWYIVTELCEHGDLKNLLQLHKRIGILFQKDELLRFSVQIASGMSYLASRKVTICL